MMIKVVKDGMKRVHSMYRRNKSGRGVGGPPHLAHSPETLRTEEKQTTLTYEKTNYIFET